MSHTVRPWSHPDCYFGQTWEGWHSAGFGQSRDSDTLEASNFQTAYDELKKLAGDFEDESTVTIVRESHWAVGWIEWIAIHSTNTAALDAARQLCERANNYPVLDESDWSRREYEECEQVWRECYDPSERIKYLRTHSYTARSLTDILQAVRSGSWYHASNMLHCPTDLVA